MFVWRIANNVIPTKKNFVDRLGSGDCSCPLCHEESEISVHLFFYCQIARAIWFGCYWDYTLTGLMWPTMRTLSILL
jgi:hypothetical protein